MFATVAAVHAQTVVGGQPMPTLDDERATYTGWAWTWPASAEPDFPSDSGYSVSGPDIHGDTEGDDLWSYLMMYLRSGQGGYLDRAEAWARYFIQDYRNSSSFDEDRDGFGLDHLYGWGLVAWYEYTGDAAALTEAENIAAEVESIWSGRTPGQHSMATSGLRQAGRHLLLATRVAEATQKARWITLRDHLIDLWLQSPDWDSNRGMYFTNASFTNDIVGGGSYAAGARIVPAFHVGILAEAFAHAYRTSGRNELRERVIAMARFVSANGLDATYQYTGRFFGFFNGPWHNYSAGQSVNYWDPVYTTAQVNLLVYGCRFASDPALCERAKIFFNRGTKGIYGEPVQRAAPDDGVHHFVDTRFASSSGFFYLDYNKGELQYTYQIFAPTGLPQPRRPMPPTNVRAQ